VTREGRKEGRENPESRCEKRGEKYGALKKYFPILPKASRDTNDYRLAINAEYEHRSSGERT
jgi:hypothetical protein